MTWEHFEIRDFGKCKIKHLETGTLHEAHYDMGFITTGKSHVFWGYQLMITSELGIFTGRSKGYAETYSLALRDCNTQLAAAGLQLLVAGNSRGYNESAMSAGSGYGYLPGKKQGVSIMSYWQDELASPVKEP